MLHTARLCDSLLRRVDDGQTVFGPRRAGMRPFCTRRVECHRLQKRTVRGRAGRHRDGKSSGGAAGRRRSASHETAYQCWALSSPLARPGQHGAACRAHNLIVYGLGYATVPSEAPSWTPLLHSRRQDKIGTYLQGVTGSNPVLWPGGMLGCACRISQLSRHGVQAHET
jgi:hypothetical protein